MIIEKFAHPWWGIINLPLDFPRTHQILSHILVQCQLGFVAARLGGHQFRCHGSKIGRCGLSEAQLQLVNSCLFGWIISFFISLMLLPIIFCIFQLIWTLYVVVPLLPKMMDPHYLLLQLDPLSEIQNTARSHHDRVYPNC